MKTHGMRRTPEWNTWQKVIARCENPSGDKWQYYGGRGIRIDPSWRHDFAVFFAHIGPRPTPQHSIDRIDPDGHYAPGNVRWATKGEQRANQRPGAKSSMYWLGKKHPATAGERNSKAKLTEAKVIEIRALRASGMSQPKIAALFGVSTAAICDVVNRKTWAHV